MRNAVEKKGPGKKKVAGKGGREQDIFLETQYSSLSTIKS